MNIIEGKKFKREFKKLQKKYPSLQNDFGFLRALIRELPLGDGSKHWNILKQEDEKYIMKIRMMCRSVRGSQFRVIYYYDGENIEISFIEIYFKGNKETEDAMRIKELWKDKIS